MYSEMNNLSYMCNYIVHVNILRYLSLAPRLSLHTNGSYEKLGRAWEQGYECFYEDEMEISGKGGRNIQ